MTNDPELKDRIEKMSAFLHHTRARKPCGCDLSHCFECFARIAVDRLARPENVVALRKQG